MKNTGNCIAEQYIFIISVMLHKIQIRYSTVVSRYNIFFIQLM